MPIKTYNNNDKQPTTTTFSSVAFSNPESKIMASRFSITYFNKLMKISIALRNNAGSNDQYATYDNDNQISVYVSSMKAEILRRMIYRLQTEDDIHNVCIELKNGLLKISDGEEYGVDHPCFSISYADESGNVTEVIYECKTDIYTGAYNYKDGEFSTIKFVSMEIDTLSMVLDQYYKASSYAVAASVNESNMYRRESTYHLLRAIADKVGVPQNSGSSPQNTKSFLSGSSSNSTSVTNIPTEYQVSSFDAIAASM